MRGRSKELFESLRRSWASWVALSIPILLLLGIAIFGFRVRKRQATIDWLSNQGGSVRFEPIWITKQIPTGAREWLDKKLGGKQWSKPFEKVTYVNLEKVHLEDEDFGRLRKFRQLEVLYLKNLSETGLSELRGLSQLETLNLWKSDVVDDEIRELPGFSKIEVFWGSSNITDSGLASIGKLPRLRRLVLTQSKITDAGLANLAGLSELKYLSLFKTGLDGSGFVHLKGLTKLNHLDLFNTNMTDAGLEHLRGVSRLDTLYLSGTNITDGGLANLAGLSELGYLRLNNTAITDAGLEGWQGALFRLRSLELKGTKISGAGLVHLQDQSSSLETLDLSRTNITDEGLKHLQGFSRLTTLNLNGTNITDEGLEHLRDLPKLSYLELQETRVTEDGVKRLEKAISGNQWDSKIKWSRSR